jgi:hypothetical protein
MKLKEAFAGGRFLEAPRAGAAPPQILKTWSPPSRPYMHRPCCLCHTTARRDHQLHRGRRTRPTALEQALSRKDVVEQEATEGTEGRGRILLPFSQWNLHGAIDHSHRWMSWPSVISVPSCWQLNGWGRRWLAPGPPTSSGQTDSPYRSRTGPEPERH